MILVVAVVVEIKRNRNIKRVHKKKEMDSNYYQQLDKYQMVIIAMIRNRRRLLRIIEPTN